MRLGKGLKSISVISGALIAGFLSGCLGGQGSTDGDSGADSGLRDETFVSDEETTGSVSLNVASTSLEVGNTTEFSVQAVNSRQQPVANINVACDSEKGVAILEPARGFALTNNDGVMSGIIGCEAPGSFQFLCRLAVGANKRRFVSVNCTGDVPSGFQGFPGAAGGGLGGGSQTNDDGDVRITSAGFIDNGALGGDTASTSASIDISQIADCDGDPATSDVEPFFDTYVQLAVLNNFSEQVLFESLQYNVSDVDGRGVEFTSKKIGLTQEVNSSIVSGGGKALIQVPIFKAYNGAKYVGDPLGSGIKITNSALIPVSFTLFGKTASGDSVQIRARATASFGPLNRCG